MMERIQVSEGFLGGLDLHLHPGLNVLIGPRGSGKTSIELIRFCLATPSYSGSAREDVALATARAVLGFAETARKTPIAYSAFGRRLSAQA
jgi:recombinational DNA repair ATPase RecF